MALRCHFVIFLFAALLGTAAQDVVAPLARLRLEKQAQTPWPANVGIVDIFPPLAASGRFSVSTVDGKMVPAQMLWSATGEPSVLEFDTSDKAVAYYVNFGTNAGFATGSWKPAAGVILETRACKGQSADTLDQVNRLVASSPVYGRGFVADIFLGLNPYGPSTDYATLFSGWFSVSHAGLYQFATVSGGPSRLQIDGQPVAEWLGRHLPGGGRHGEHSGQVQLTAGVHRIDYLGIQFDGPAAAEAAWKPPGQDRLEVMPASAFLPVARFRVTALEPTRSGTDQVYLEWHNVDHCRLGDALVVRVRFGVIDSGVRHVYKWQFDDGSEAAGAAPRHFFPQPGLRTVKLAVWDRQVCIATNTVRIRVNPDWSQMAEWRQNILDEAVQDFLTRNLSLAPARDLSAILDLAESTQDQALLVHAGQAALKRSEEFIQAADGITFYKLGSSLQHYGDSGDRLAQQALHLALTPQRATPSILSKARLRLAELLLRCGGPLDEAEKLLNGLSADGLVTNELRLARLLDGDLLLARGKIEAAHQQYSKIAASANGPNPRFSLGRTAVLESASVSLQHGDYEEAQQALDQLTSEVPLERMAVDVGLLRIELDLKRQEFQRALACSQVLLAVGKGTPQEAALLYDVVDSALLLHQTDAAQKALRQLLEEFPYSEAAAKAKDRWKGAK